jgi:hypothetical protein
VPQDAEHLESVQHPHQIIPAATHAVQSRGGADQATMSDTPKQAFFQSSNSSTSTLRPRQTRLISFLDEEDLSTAELQENQQDGAGQANTGSSSTLGRSISNVLNRKAGKQKQPRPTSEDNHLIPNAGLWDSWQSISGIASTLLGSDTQAQVKGMDKRAGKAPSWQKRNSTFTTRTAVPAWGRSLESTPHMTVSAVEERQAMVLAKKREALLLANVHEGPDLTGRYKRRDSDADFSSVLSPPDSEQDVLVYVHRIQPLDTLAGVMIKYSCQPEVFRKINRLWPNDNIQTKKQVFLPVDACTVRGKKIDNIGANLDLLSSQLENASLTQEPSSDPNAESASFHSPAISSPSIHPISLTTSPDASDYRHESWVQLAHFALPTEILRIPRRTLGYFPPARRKSGPASPVHSTTSTPKSSVDMLRHPPTHAASLNASPVRRPRMQVTRQRSSSTATSNLSFIDHLKGPGGVGTLRGLRMESARPGPAEDSLNRKFKEYLPNVNLAPPEDIPRASLTRSTPRASTDSIRSTSSTGLGEVGGAIEGWVRKLGGAKAPRGMVGGRMGDLIELDTHSDSGMGDGEEEGDQTPTLAGGGMSAT